jgi:2-dehydro-3-deoxyphosphogluconate aldolase/(4S)-4-hydroxy-2-oxoglutarate aldolase
LAWFGAGAACVGIGSKLISKQAVTGGDFDGIARKTSQVLAWIQEARGATA